MGRYEDAFWLLENGCIGRWHGSITDLRKDRNNVTAFSSTAHEMLSEILTLGASRLQYGSFKWSGNEFTARSKDGKNVSGRVTVPSARLPSRLEYTLNDIGTRFSVDYGYSDQLGHPFFPSTLLLRLQTPSTNVAALQLRVLSIRLGNSQVAQAAFLPEEFIRADLWKQLRAPLLYSNQVVYYVDSSGRYRIVPTLPAATYSHSSRWGRYVILCLLAGSTVLGFALWVRARRRGSASNNSTEKVE